MATEAQKSQISGALGTLSADGGSLLKTASKSQLSSLKDTLSKISAGLKSTSSSSGSITSDSSSATRTETTIGRDIEDIANRAGVGSEPDTSDLEDLQAAQEREIERQRRLLEKRRATAVAGIEEGFAVEREATEFQQKRETGQTSVDLARAGGYLGVTASQSGVMQNLVIAQRAELRALESAKQDAINQANQAYEDRDFELAQEKLKSAREIETEIFNRRNTFFNQQMDMLGEERAQMQNERESVQFLRDQANDRLDRILEAGIDPDISDLTEISRGLGVSIDEANAIVKAGKETRDLEMKQARTDRDVAIASVLRGIPRDQTVVIDGVTYRGLAELSSSGSGSTATERRQAQQDAWKAMLMEDLRGGFTEDGTEITPITLDEAIKTYPELDTKTINEIFKTINDYEDKTTLDQKLAANEWDIFVPYNTGGTEQSAFVYDKKRMIEDAKKWEQDSAGGWLNVGAKGNDATVTIDGETYTGTADPQGNAPITPYKYRINTSALND